LRQEYSENTLNVFSSSCIIISHTEGQTIHVTYLHKLLNTLFFCINMEKTAAKHLGI